MRILKFSFAFAIILLFGSCESKVDESLGQKTTTRSDSSIETFVRNGFTFIAGDVNVTCGSDKCTGGNVGPTDKCQVGSDLNGYFECTCSGCKMTVTSDAVIQDHDIIEQLNVDNNDELAKTYIFEKHKESLSGFRSISYHFSVAKTVITYEYELNNGDIETIMYTNNYDENGMLAKKFEIDCTGTCGCREQYNHNTGISSCSCDECKMTVTEIEEEKTHEGGN